MLTAHCCCCCCCCSYNLDFPPAYNSWDRVDPLELFGAETLKGEANPKVTRTYVPIGFMVYVPL